ncbi:29018_t:CDS:2, partial [Gigaspora margarita]
MTWKQIKFIREKSYKGKVVIWFSLIKKKYLTNSSNREIRERLSMHNPYNMLIMTNKADIKEDNRIKNWVLIEEKENSMTIRQIDKTEQVLEKCSSCELNSNKEKENIANQKVLPVSKEVIARKKTGNLIVEASLARHLVKSQISNKVLSLDLLEALEQNILNRKKVYKFYMNSFFSSQGVIGASWVQISLEHNIVVAK